MEITDTIVQFGRKDMLIALGLVAVAIVLFIVYLVIAESPFGAFASMVFGFVSAISFIVFAFLPEETLYKATIHDYQSVQDEGYRIVKHIEDDRYYIEKASEEELSKSETD